MRRLVQINPVVRVSTSTGRIMQEIGELAMGNGWQSYIAYSRGRDGIRPCRSELIPVGNRLSVLCHGVATRLFDRHGLASRLATIQFIRRLESIRPDIIHIHNIHGYFLDYRLLFSYLSRCSVPVVWTVHDCWLYTGHCYYYYRLRQMADWLRALSTAWGVPAKPVDRPLTPQLSGQAHSIHFRSSGQVDHRAGFPVD